MTDGNDPVDLYDSAGFYVAVAAEVDEDDHVADIVFKGKYVARVHLVGKEWFAGFYGGDDETPTEVPLRGVIDALQRSLDRLTYVYEGDPDPDHRSAGGERT